MAIEYIMRAYKTSLPDGYVVWGVVNAPDYTGQFSGYNPDELTDIVIDYQVPTRVNGSAGPVIGFANGDLQGQYPNPTVAALQTRPISPNQPTNGQVLTWDQVSSSWMPKMPPGVIPGSLVPNTVVITAVNSMLTSGPTFGSTPDGYVMQVVGGALTFLPGAVPMKLFEVVGVAGSETTALTVFQTVGAFSFDITQLATGTKTITLNTIISTTGTVIELQLYDLVAGAAVQLLQSSQVLSTNSITPILVVSQDLSTLLTNGPSQYEVRIRQTTVGSATDQVICEMCKLLINWS